MEKRFALVDGQPVLVQVERPVSAHALALVVDAAGAGDEADRLVASFHAQGVATARVALPVGLGRHGATERWISELSDWARVEEADGLPICFSAVGAASSHMLRAAAHARPIAGVVAWNGSPWRAWGALPSIDVPGLLLVDDDARGRAWLARLAANHMAGPAAAAAVGADPTEVLGRWLMDPMSLVAPPTRHSAARRLAPVVMLAALAVPTLAAVSASADRYATVPVRVANQIDPGAPADPNADPKPDKAAKWAALGLDPAKIHGDGVSAAATGSKSLIDGGGLEFFVNTNITFNTTSSASAANSEASFTAGHPVTTSGGGTVNSTLGDGFDGYQSLYVQLAGGAPTQPATGNPAYVFYNKNGAAPTVECSGRQFRFPVQAMGSGINAQRTFYVPTADTYARWVNSFTNTGGTATTITVGAANNLGSDTDTRVVTSSSGDASVTTADLWSTSFQNYSGTTSSDPRLGHVYQGVNAPTGLAGINFVNGDDKPFWGYTITLQPGETISIMNFVTGQNNKAAAAAKAAELAGTIPQLATQGNLACLSLAEIASIRNYFAPPVITPKFTG